MKYYLSVQFSLLISFFSLHISVASREVIGVVGGRAEIPCDLTAPFPSDEPHIILFYKDAFGTPIYRFVFVSFFAGLAGNGFFYIKKNTQQDGFKFEKNRDFRIKVPKVSKKAPQKRSTIFSRKP